MGSQIEEKVKQIIGEKLLSNDHKIEDLSKDYADILILKETLDMEFGLRFEPSLLFESKTVGDVVNLISNLVEKNKTD
ncbi:hypothetical protein GXP67_00970 [Rhodocytophaga rosea]|uniref:Acyl carrier protein n=1 Tax=Rhodocytophaga rosea TaxID=2704465 RepID=A0A6C0GBX3_9BACT|nr:hypothetical protein [Rhodocytophaga rosea]QHT65344.1 hypothetical protein GXP67_00970 [Rhodocytophaga rosea]